MKRLLFSLLLLLAVGGADAYDFTVDGISYAVIGVDEVAVVRGDQPYMGHVTVPATVSDDGHTYRVTQIADAAFYDNPMLYRVSIPATVTAIGDEAFARSLQLRSFVVAAGNPSYSTIDGVLTDKSHQRLVAYPNARGNTYAVPSGITEIEPWAFLGCTRLAVLTLPTTVRAIGQAAFYGCSSLTSVILPNSVTTVGVWAFSECTLLERVTIGNSVTTIGDGAFSFCPHLQSLHVMAANSHYATTDDALLSKDGTTLVTFPGGKGGSYHIPDGVQTIAPQAFYGCNALERVTLPPSVTTLGDGPFLFCDNLREILVGSDHPTLTSRGGVLMNKAGTDILYYPNGKSGAYTIPDGVADLHSGTFLGSRQLTSVTIPDGVESIGDWTFMDCGALHSVSLPTTLEAIGERAFDCNALTTVICSSEPLQTAAFAGCDYTHTTLYVPKGNENTFRQTAGWDVFGSYRPFGLYAKDATVRIGQDGEIPLYTTGPLHLTRGEVTVEFPAIAEAKAAADGTMVRLADGLQGTITCTPEGSHRYRLTITCTDQRTLTAEADPLCYLSVACAPTAEEGVYDLTLRETTVTYHSDLHSGSTPQPDQTAGLYVADPTGIVVTTAERPAGAVYNLQGQQVRPAGASRDGLAAGVYIVNGKKVLLTK